MPNQTAADEHVSGRLPAEIWELTAEEWRSLNSPAQTQNNPASLQARSQKAIDSH